MPDPEPPRHPSRFQKKTLWIAITAVAMVVIGAIAVGAILLMGWVLGVLQPVLVPLAVAGIIAYLLDPIIAWLQRKGWSHRRSMLTVYVAFVVVVVLLAVAVIVPSFGQAQDLYENRRDIQTTVTEFVKESIAELRGRLDVSVAEKYYDRGVEWISEEGGNIAQRFGSWIWDRLRGAFGFFGYLLGLLLVPIYLYYFLKESHSISERWQDYLPIRASEFKDQLVETLREINGYLISFFRGQMVVSLIDGALVAFALSVIRLPYALLIGVFLAILGLIPYIGNILVMVPAILIALVHFGATATGSVMTEAPAVVGEVARVQIQEDGGVRIVEKVVTAVADEGRTATVLLHAWNWLPEVWAYPVIVLAIFVILQQVNGLVTAPRIVGDSVGLHPLTVIFSVLFWSLLLGGLLGALLAVPLSAAIKVLFRRYVWERKLEPAVEARLGRAAGESPPPAASD